MNEILKRYPEEVRQILAKYPDSYRKSAVMPLLYLAQRERNYLTRQSIASRIVAMSFCEPRS